MPTVNQALKGRKILKKYSQKFIHLVFSFVQLTVYTRVQVEFFGCENGLKKSTSTYIRENMRHTYRITKKCQNSLQQAKLRS